MCQLITESYEKNIIKQFHHYVNLKEYTYIDLEGIDQPLDSLLNQEV